MEKLQCHFKMMTTIKFAILQIIFVVTISVILIKIRLDKNNSAAVPMKSQSFDNWNESFRITSESKATRRFLG